MQPSSSGLRQLGPLRRFYLLRFGQQPAGKAPPSATSRIPAGRPGTGHLQQGPQWSLRAASASTKPPTLQAASWLQPKASGRVEVQSLGRISGDRPRACYRLSPETVRPARDHSSRAIGRTSLAKASSRREIVHRERNAIEARKALAEGSDPPARGGPRARRGPP